MVVSKQRYLIVKIESKEKANISTVFVNMLLEELRYDFGELILSKVDKLELCEYYENISIAILKCNLEVYKYLTYVLVTTRIPNKRFTIISVSGILKKAKVKLLKYLENKKKQNEKSITA